MIGLFDTEDREGEAVAYLRSLGYTVVEPVPALAKRINKSKDLIHYFYSLLQFYHPERIIHYSEDKRDEKTVKLFIAARKTKNKPLKTVLQECARLIRCIIENEEVFKLSHPITSLECLGQDKMKWITDKAIMIINGEDIEVSEHAVDQIETQLCTEYEKTAIDKLPNRLKELNSFLEVLNAKKE